MSRVLKVDVLVSVELTALTRRACVLAFVTTLEFVVVFVIGDATMLVLVDVATLVVEALVTFVAVAIVVALAVLGKTVEVVGPVMVGVVVTSGGSMDSAK
jgi:hypothetical protein